MIDIIFDRVFPFIILGLWLYIFTVHRRQRRTFYKQQAEASEAMKESLKLVTEANIAIAKQNKVIQYYKERYGINPIDDAKIGLKLIKSKYIKSKPVETKH